MAWVRVVLLALAVVEGAWMAFDGSRALTMGDYVTPASGDHAGQLGPWHHVASAVGIPPRSTPMKWIFVAYGLTWLTIAFGFATRAPWASRAMPVAAIATLWYLPIGTLCSVIQLGILLWMRRAA